MHIVTFLSRVTTAGNLDQRTEGCWCADIAESAAGMVLRTLTEHPDWTIEIKPPSLLPSEAEQVRTMNRRLCRVESALEDHTAFRKKLEDMSPAELAHYKEAFPGHILPSELSDKADQYIRATTATGLR